MPKAAFKSDVAPTFFTPQAAPPEELGRVIELNQKFSEGSRSTAGKGLELVVEGARLELPATVTRMLRDIVSELAKGAMVTLLPSHRELTTQEAADILNVSRTYMVRLLDEKAIPFTKVNKHRRIRADDLMNYKKTRDVARQEGLRQMTREAQKMGEYFEKQQMLDPLSRSQEKQASRERDEADLASSHKSKEQLRMENGHFARLNIRPNLGAAKALS